MLELTQISLTDPMKIIEEQGWRACLRDAPSYKELMTSPGQWPKNAILWRPDNVDRVSSDDDGGTMLDLME